MNLIGLAQKDLAQDTSSLGHAEEAHNSQVSDNSFRLVSSLERGGFGETTNRIGRTGDERSEVSATISQYGQTLREVRSIH